MKNFLLGFLVLLLTIPAFGQQPQTQNAPIYAVNAKYTQGVGTGYWPNQLTSGTGLTLDIASGTAYCGSTIKHYTGGTLSLTANTTNYVYLDTSSSCVPAVNTSGFSATTIPIATIVTGSSNITSLDDDRTEFFQSSNGASSITQLHQDVTAIGPGNVAATVVGINNTLLSGLSTGLLKNTTGTGVPSIAVVTDIESLLAGLSGCGTNGNVLTALGSSTFNCQTPSAGSVVKVNGTSVSNPNFNGTSPSAPTGYQNGVFQYDISGNVSVNLPLIGISANTTLVFTGTSINDDDAEVLGTPITITGWTCSAGVCTFTNSGTNGFSAGDWVNVRFLSGWFTPPSPVILGTGYTLFQVSSTGLTTTQFKFNYSLNTGTCSSSCGTVETAMYNLPFLATKIINPTALANTVMLLPTTVTIAGLASNYSTLFHSISPAVTGNPGYFVINNFNNDVGSCIASATTEVAYQSVFSQAHTDGWTIVVGTGTAAAFNTTGCTNRSLIWSTDEQWLIAQGPTLANKASSNEYWDFVGDLATDLPNAFNANLINQTNNAFNPTGATLAASDLSRVINSHTSDVVNTRNVLFGRPQDNNSNPAENGYVEVNASTVPTWGHIWMKSDYSGVAMAEGDSGVELDVPTAVSHTTSSGSNTTVLSVNENGTVSSATNNPLFSVYGPNLPTSTHPSLEIGHDQSTNNTATLLFQYAGASSTSNYVTLSLRGTNGIKIDGSGNVIVQNISSSTSPICPNGTGGSLTTSGCASGSSPLTTKGDIYTYSTVDARLPVGADGTVLGADSTQTTGLKWVTPLTNPMTTQGDIIVGGASGAANRLAAGTNTYVLTSNGPGNIPSWQAGGSGGSGNFINLASSLTGTGCTFSSGACVVSGTPTTVTISTIPGTYIGLHILYSATTASASTRAAMSVQFNADSGAHYNDNYFGGITGTDNGATSAYVGEVGGSGSPLGGGSIEIPFYSSSAAKFYTSAITVNQSSAVGVIFNGNWTQTGAITSITFTLGGTDTFVNGSEFVVYGMN